MARDNKPAVTGDLTGTAPSARVTGIYGARVPRGFTGAAVRGVPGAIALAVRTVVAALAMAQDGGVSAAVLTSSGGAALTLRVGESTPEQLYTRATWSTARVPGTLVRVQYKLPASGTWTDGPWLSEFLASEVLAVDTNAPGSGAVGAEPGLAVADGFGAYTYHLLSGTTYDVRLSYIIPGQSVAYTASQSYTTRALPAALPAANKTCTTSTIVAALAGLAPGDHLQLQAGTYAPFTVNVSGTQGNPIYISCAPGASVVYAVADKIITMNGTDVVLDAMTITGTNVDNEAVFMSSGGSLAGVYSTAFYTNSVTTARVTVRNSTITGVDVFLKGWSESTQWLVYNNTISGNNSHAVQYTIPPGETYPRSGWNDSCINWHGNGNCAFNNTIQGFGDTVKHGFSTAPAGFETRNNHVYRNRILRGADDAYEADNSVSGSFYRNHVANVSNLVSLDGCYEGPHDVFENVCINPGYDILKLKGGSVNGRVFHNTLIVTNKNGTNHGLYTSNVSWHSRFVFQNNLFIYRGTGNAMHWSAPLDSGPVFDHNAWYSSTEDYFMSTPIYGSAATLAEAKTVFAPRFAGDVGTTSNPFPVTITLGANAQTEYTAGVFDVTLSGGTTPLNAGAVIPGINDGFTGAAPTMGAVWGGQVPFYVGQGAPALNIDGSNDWTPNRDAFGNILSSDWTSLPVGTTLRAVGSLARMQDVQKLPTGVYRTSSGSDDFPNYRGAWNGAAWDAVRKRLRFVANGGHGDGHPTSNGSYYLDGLKLQFTRDKDPTAITNTQALNQNTLAFLDFGSDPYNTSPGAGISLWPGGYSCPQKDGTPGGAHTVWSTVLLPPAAMQAIGFTGNANGGVAMFNTYQGLLNFDDMAWSTLIFNYPGYYADPYVFAFLGPDNKVYGLTSQFKVSRYTLTGTSSSLWSATSRGSYDYFVAGPATAKWQNASGAFCRAQERGEVLWIGSLDGAAAVTASRLRTDAAITSGNADWSSFIDTITLTGAGLSNLTPATMNDHGSYTGVYTDHPFRAALFAYDHAADCAYIVSNFNNGKRLKVSGISGSTWTVTEDAASAATRAAEAMYNFNAGAVYSPVSGVQVLLKYPATNAYPEITRLS